ncbi:MAG: dihydroorotase [Lachnospiraceae bacterium]|nr:dihydroorotase [Lachnospiraceae bacterium]
MTTLIKSGRVINPSKKSDKVQDILIENGIITKCGENISGEFDEVIDAGNLLVMPGLIDLHVHLREPGFEYKETIETGSKAAAKGGFTSICAMPNTKPVTDSRETVEYILNKAKEVSPINVLVVGAVTKGQAGKELSDIEGMKQAGICAISEDGKSVMNSGLYREAMHKAKELGIPVLAHCEDITMVQGGAINKGKKSEELGVKGISNAVEDVIVARDILIAKETGARLHLCHCSTFDSAKMVEDAKKEGLPVTAEVCPHHFTLSEEDILENDANYKMNPPVRGKEDLEALREGLHSDIFDVIATDHAPHSAEEKARGIETAPFGIVGSETAVALTMTELVHKGLLTYMQMAEKMSYNPAKVLGIEKGTLDEGAVADIVIIDPEKEYVIDSDTFLSKGKNTPFNGYKAKGMVVRTIVAGKTVYEV